MRIRRVSIRYSCLALSLLVAVAVQAQSSASGAQASDSWSKPPASASSTPYRSRSYGSDSAATGTGHFTFKPVGPATPADPTAPIPGARPQVMGAAMTPDGRPPLNCRTSPHDPQCQ